MRLADEWKSHLTDGEPRSNDGRLISLDVESANATARDLFRVRRAEGAVSAAACCFQTVVATNWANQLARSLPTLKSYGGCRPSHGWTMKEWPLVSIVSTFFHTMTSGFSPSKNNPLSQISSSPKSSSRAISREALLRKYEERPSDRVAATDFHALATAEVGHYRPRSPKHYSSASATSLASSRRSVAGQRLGLERLDGGRDLVGVPLFLTTARSSRMASTIACCAAAGFRMAFALPSIVCAAA